MAVGEPLKASKVRFLCNALTSSNLLTIVVIIGGVLIFAYIKNGSTMNGGPDSFSYRGMNLGADQDLDVSDPFKYLPPESELKAAQQQHEQLRKALAEERSYAKQLTDQIDDELRDQNCPLKGKSALSLNCAHIEERGWREIGGVRTYFITTECSDALKNGYPWVLFLHGAAFSAQTWVDLNMLRLTAKTGFNNLAIDLPGYGNSSKPSSKVDPVHFLDAVLAEFKLDKVVIVSPSMSGSYSIQYLQKRNAKLAGFVAVAPGSLDSLQENDLQTIETPTLVIYGEKDTGMGFRSRDVLGKLKNSKTFEVKNAGHPCYKDQPLAFTVEFFKFLMCALPK